MKIAELTALHLTDYVRWYSIIFLVFRFHQFSYLAKNIKQIRNRKYTKPKKFIVIDKQKGLLINIYFL